MNRKLDYLINQIACSQKARNMLINWDNNNKIKLPLNLLDNHKDRCQTCSKIKVKQMKVNWIIAGQQCNSKKSKHNYINNNNNSLNSSPSLHRININNKWINKITFNSNSCCSNSRCNSNNISKCNRMLNSSLMVILIKFKTKWHSNSNNSNLPTIPDSNTNIW